MDADQKESTLSKHKAGSQQSAVSLLALLCGLSLVFLGQHLLFPQADDRFGSIGAFLFRSYSWLSFALPALLFFFLERLLSQRLTLSVALRSSLMIFPFFTAVLATKIAFPTPGQSLASPLLALFSHDGNLSSLVLTGLALFEVLFILFVPLHSKRPASQRSRKVPARAAQPEEETQSLDLPSLDALLAVHDEPAPLEKKKSAPLMSKMKGVLSSLSPSADYAETQATSASENKISSPAEPSAKEEQSSHSPFDSDPGQSVSSRSATPAPETAPIIDEAVAPKPQAISQEEQSLADLVRLDEALKTAEKETATISEAIASYGEPSETPAPKLSTENPLAQSAVSDSQTSSPVEKTFAQMAKATDSAASKDADSPEPSKSQEPDFITVSALDELQEQPNAAHAALVATMDKEIASLRDSLRIEESQSGESKDITVDLDTLLYPENDRTENKIGLSSLAPLQESAAEPPLAQVQDLKAPSESRPTTNPRLSDSLKALHSQPVTPELPPNALTLAPAADRLAKVASRAPSAQEIQNQYDGGFPMTLLTPSRKDHDTPLEDKSLALLQVLSDFHIEAQITGIAYGPSVTLYEVQPAPGVKLSRIAALSDNIALALAVSKVRVVGPIRGKKAIGVEVPRKIREIVHFRELLEESGSQPIAKIPLYLGKSIGGQPKILDLTRAPHLLIAGATGSGKSACINAMIMSILKSCSPDEVKMLLIDPKIVELKVYDGITPLLAPVITSPVKAIKALRWATQEMEERYRRLESVGAREIGQYNQRIAEDELAQEKMPYIVIVIDEFADLMATAPKELEGLIARLAAMARAVGIHLVLATQRPSIDVITGLIKSNFSTRIAFMVASKTDSRIILDEGGAEDLLGKGDMLLSAPWEDQLERLQGGLVSIGEVEAVTKFVKSRREPVYLEDEIFGSDEDEDEESSASAGRDPLYKNALDIVLSEGKASASYFQRRLKIGYNRAARLVEQMEREQVVGPADRNGSRAILIETAQ